MKIFTADETVSYQLLLPWFCFSWSVVKERFDFFQNVGRKIFRSNTLLVTSLLFLFYLILRLTSHLLKKPLIHSLALYFWVSQKFMSDWSMHNIYFGLFLNRYIVWSFCVRLACYEKRVYNCFRFFHSDSSFFSTTLNEIFGIFVERNLQAFSILSFAVSCSSNLVLQFSRSSVAATSFEEYSQM